ncbi:MAG: hypothetical protein PHS30_01370 [Bacteroidales bacterium]|nr:hypothetical protein [Bacteroidales bacterium]
MKKFRTLLFLAALFLIHPSDISAQIRVNININSQPQWGPEEYDYVEYYYMPEFGIYYYAPKAQFIYRNGNRWVFSYNLPDQYRHVNLYSTYKVVINEPRPYLRNRYYSSHYKNYRNYHSKQGTIRDSKNPRYKNGNNHQGHSADKMGHQPQNRNMQSMPAVKNNKDSHGTIQHDRKNNGQENQDHKGKKNDRR